MRLRTKLVLTASALTFAIVLVLSMVFLGQLLRQRIEQTYADNDAFAKGVVLSTRKAVETGLLANPPVATPPGESADEMLHAAVLDALRSDENLQSVMDRVVTYSDPVQDVSVTDPHGFTMVSTDPDTVNQRAAYRDDFARLRDSGVIQQVRQVFGPPRVLDIAEPLDRNHLPFLVVHVGVRSTFLRAAIEPWLRDALEFVLIAILDSVAAAALLSAVALHPLKAIGERLEQLTLTRGDGSPTKLLEAPLKGADPVGRVTRTIDRLGQQMRSREEGYTALQANLNQMLDTLRDGVLLFAPDQRAVMVSDAVAHFLESPGSVSEASLVDDMVGKRLEEIFLPDTALGDAVLAASRVARRYRQKRSPWKMGARFSYPSIVLAMAAWRTAAPAARVGTITPWGRWSPCETPPLRSNSSRSWKSRAVWPPSARLTANVGHEVKNPINAMVVHLELLRGKLAAGAVERESAQKHVEILADEMHRLDRVVETLADFSRPMELDLREHDLRRVVEQTLELAGAELREHGIRVEVESPSAPVPVRVDAELMRQALLNLLLNAMQAMPSAGIVRVSVRRDHRFAMVEIADNGLGIPAALLPRIFDLYFTTKAKGSGIGLAMTYRILQLHGGAMEVRSNADPASPQRGTTFTLSIPVSATPVNENRKPTQLAHPPDIDPHSAGGEPANAVAANIESMDRKEIA